MLDSSDKDFIRTEIRKALGDSVKEPKKQGKDRKNEYYKLERKVLKGDDSLAERIRYESLKRTSKILDKLDKVIPDSVTKAGKATYSGVKATGKGIANSSLGRGIYNTLMYSNPITALIAQNTDLLKAFGKGSSNILKGLGNLGSGTANLIYKKFKSNRGQSTSLIESRNNNTLPSNIQKLISTSNNNYIMARNAVFVGGKNYINVMPATSQMPSFSLNDKKSDIVNNRKNLNLPEGPVIDLIAKSNKDQLAEAKVTNKLLTAINKRAILIGAAVLLGVGAIAALALWLRNKKPIRKSMPKIDTAQQLNSFRSQQNQDFNNVKDRINEGVKKEAHISKYDQFNKIPQTKGGKSIWTPLRSGYQAESQEDSVYRAPFDLKVKSWKENSKKLGIVNIIAEKISSGVNKDIEIMNVKDPIVVPGEIVKRGQPIGLVGPGGGIFIKDISKKDFESYLSDINKYADSNEKESFDIDNTKQEKLKKSFKMLADHKESLPSIEAFADPSQDAYLKQQQDISSRRNIANEKILQEAIDNNYNGTMLNGRFIPKQDLHRELNKYKEINKNAEIARSQAIEANMKKPNSTRESTVKDMGNNKLSINIKEPTQSSRVYGLYQPMDIAASNSSQYTLIS